MNTDKKYRLLKKYESPRGTCHIGVEHTAREWQQVWFPNLKYEDFEIKDDWFEEVLPEQSKQPPIGSKGKKIRATNVSFESNSNLIKVFINGNVSDVVGRLSVDKILDNMTNALNDELPIPSPKPQEDKRIEVSALVNDVEKSINNPCKAYSFFISKDFPKIPEHKFPAIKSAIENVLNGERRVYSQGQVDAMMENVWNSAREAEDTDMPYKFKTFQDYRKSNL